MDSLSGLTEVEFLWGWVIAFLPLPWIIRRFIKPIAKRQSPLLAPHIMSRLKGTLIEQKMLEANTKSFPISSLFILLWLLLLLAASRPIGFSTPIPFQVSGKELMMAVDLSGSMRKEDMYLKGDDVNRLTAVKHVVADFIEQRQGDRIGLVVFGTQAFLQSPLTYDLQTVKILLNEAEIGMAGNNTAIGDAIGLTLKHLRQTQQKNAVLILLTDGSNTAGKVAPIKAAEMAKKLGLKIYTIGVGRVASPSGLDQFFASQPDIDVDTLKRISQLTGGQFFQANNTQQLSEIYTSINKLESIQHDVHSYRVHSELYIWPLGAAFILSLLIAILRLKATVGLA